MMLNHVDPNDVQIGDTLAVKGRVILTHLRSGPTDRYVVVQFSNGQTADVGPEDFVSRTPAPPPPLKVGERVCWNSGPALIQTSRIIAIDGDEAWLKMDADGRRGTLLLADLRRLGG